MLLTGALGFAALAGGVAAAALPVTTTSAGPQGHPAARTTRSSSTRSYRPCGDDGNDLPGAQAPHSLAKVNPLTTPNRNHTGYDYNEDHIAGFTATNLDGVGGSGGGGDLLVVPTSVQYDKRPASSTYAHAYSHDDETATPGYYGVGLGAVSGTGSSVTQDSGTIDAEMTATTRTALQRYSFPSGSDPELVLDLANNFTSRTRATMKATTLPDGTTSISRPDRGVVQRRLIPAVLQRHHERPRDLPEELG